jgi:hypothetical protein
MTNHKRPQAREPQNDAQHVDPDPPAAETAPNPTAKALSTATKKCANTP